LKIVSSQPAPTNPQPERTDLPPPPSEPRPEPSHSEEVAAERAEDPGETAEAFKLPDPDPDNITVLTNKLPNKPILPWNRYDSPGQEDEVAGQVASESADDPDAADAAEGETAAGEGDRESDEPEVDEVE